MPAAAEGYCGPATQPKGLSFLIDDLEVALHAKRAITEDGDFGARHEFLRRTTENL
jgi:hypothetical protein